MTLDLDGDDLVVFGQGGEDRPPQVDCPEGAMEQHQWLTGAVDLVVHLQPVDRRVSSLRGSGGLRLCEAPRWRDQGGTGRCGHGNKCPSPHHFWVVLSYVQGEDLRATHVPVPRRRAVSPLLPWRVWAVYTSR